MFKTKNILYITLVLCVICLSCASRTSPMIEAIPTEAMIDEPVAIRIVKCPANEPIELRATTVDDDSVTWVAMNTYVPSNGVVDLTSTAPASGSYDTTDAMGFMWSMEPLDSNKSVAFSSKSLTPLEIHLEVYLHDSLVATSELSRLRVRPDVVRTEIREQGLVGTLFVPKSAVHEPGIIDLTGSGGGLSETGAALFASHGYVTFALAYFGSASLPKTLTNIPLEYFEKAVQYLQQQAGVDPNRVGIVGRSRGGELALLVGSNYPEIKCVIGYVPGIFRSPGAEGPAWTLNGEPLPFVRSTGEAQVMAEIQRSIAAGEATSFTPMFNSIISDRDALRDTEIPVERINGPILLISGQDDQIWPSTVFSEIAIQRLTANNFGHKVKHLTYSNAGQAIGTPFRPTTVLEAKHPVNGVLMKLGGTPAGNAHACEDSWQQVLAFLNESLDHKHGTGRGGSESE